MKRHNFLSRKKPRQERALNNLVARIQKETDVSPEKTAQRRRERAHLSFILFGQGEVA